MASITLTVPDDIAPRVVDAVCARYGYSDTITDDQGNVIPNPTTKAAFMRVVLYQFLKRTVIVYESDKAGQEAQQTAEQAAEADIVLGD